MILIQIVHIYNDYCILHYAPSKVDVPISIGHQYFNGMCSSEAPRTNTHKGSLVYKRLDALFKI